MTSLLNRDITPEDLEAERDVPRPGVWAGEERSDLRALTQDETDTLIRHGLWWRATWGSKDDPSETIDEVARLLLALGFRPGTIPTGVRFGMEMGYHQRGGIDSDPLVRVLARRAWGDRDRTWFELRGVRKGDPVSEDGTRVARTRPGERLIGKALTDAQTGAEVLIGALDDPSRFRISRVSDRLREPVRTCTALGRT